MQYTDTDKATEPRIRRRAKENGFRAEKSRRRGTWWLRDMQTSRLVRISVNGNRPSLKLTAEEIEQWLDENYPKPERELGPLAEAVAEAVENNPGTTKDDWYVLSKQNDPLALDTEGNHEKGAWLQAAKQRLYGTRRIHNRGMHYLLMSAEVIKPDGTRYGTRDWAWLLDVINVARWLGYIPFDEITDEKNAPGIYQIRREADPKPLVAYDTEVRVPDADALQPKVSLPGFAEVWADDEQDWKPVTRQPYRIALMGEKSSLYGVLKPISDRYNTDLVLFAGTASNTRIYELARAAVEDGRPLVVLYFSDCDPSGWAMPTDVGHKLHVMQLELFPELEFLVYRVALTRDQVKEYGLPESPIETKAKTPSQIRIQAEKRRKWMDAMGVEQTEIDALATLQPDLLTRIAEKAIKPFYDETLDERVRAAADEWIDRAQNVIDEGIDQEALDEAVADIDDLRAQIQTVLDDRVAPIHDAAEQIERPDLPNAPEPKVTADAKLPEPLINSEWSFEDKIEQLRADRRDYETWDDNGDDDE
jgi:hypothetical protein